nr:hypothetical protein [Candidatus Sigynarchaeota archaeon]
MSSSQARDGIERGFARVAIKPTTMDAVTGCTDAGGIVFCPEGSCFIHLIRYPRQGVYEYKGCTFINEEVLPDDFADQEFVECYKKEFVPSIPPAIEAEIITTIIGFAPPRRIDAKPRVILAAIEN